MSWVVNSNPALVEAIVASFRDSPERAAQRLLPFKAKDWRRTEPWLDTGGLALYFLVHARASGFAGAVDENVLQSLEQKLSDNKGRTADMLQEFLAINQAFQAAGISFANLKGFTLAPESCPDLSLRHQSDYDFLVDPAHLNQARKLLEDRGYVLTGSSGASLEFKSGAAQKVSLEGRYKALPTHSVELHTSVNSKSADVSFRDERLDRLSNWACGCETFPALSSADQLIGQALHLLGHLRTEHTRPSWFLEYRHHVLGRKDDTAFWRQVFTLASREPDAKIALGLSSILAADLFGEFSVPALDSWTVDCLPPEIKLWAETYGRRAILADVPGTKLYLILSNALCQKPPAQRTIRSVLRTAPLHAPARILRPPPNDTFRLRLQREVFQLQYILYRLRFHLKQGILHAIEVRRWNRLLKERAEGLPSATDTTMIRDDKTKMLS